MGEIETTAEGRLSPLVFLLWMVLQSSCTRSDGEPLRIDPIPTNAPVISISWDCSGPGPFHSTKPVRIWLDGTVIWSTNRYGITQKLDPQFDLPIGGPPYFRAQIDSKKIARFLEALEGKGYLNGKRQLHGMTMLDGPYCDVRVSHGSQQLSLVSCVEYRKVPPDSMAEYNSRGFLNDFIEIWKVTLNGIDALMPQKGEQINPRGE